MNFRQLEHFVSIVEQGSYRAASIALGITQPALTKSIASLEDELGVALLVRSRGRAASLTVYGRLIYERGLQVLEDVDDARKSIELLRDGYSGVVRIGYGASMGASTIAHISSNLREKLPESMIHIRTGLQHELLPKMRTDQLDFLIIGGLSQISTDDLVVNSLWRDPFKVFLSTEHPLAGETDYDPSWSRDYPWLSSQRLVSTDYKAALYLGHERLDRTPKGYDVFDPAIIAQIMKRGPYMSAWPSRSFQVEVDLGILSSMAVPERDGEPWMSETHLVYRRGIPMSPAVQAAWRAIHAMDLGQKYSAGE